MGSRIYWARNQLRAPPHHLQSSDKRHCNLPAKDSCPPTPSDARRLTRESKRERIFSPSTTMITCRLEPPAGVRKQPATSSKRISARWFLPIRAFRACPSVNCAHHAPPGLLCGLHFGHCAGSSCLTICGFLLHDATPRQMAHLRLNQQKRSARLRNRQAPPSPSLA